MSVFRTVSEIFSVK